MIKNVIFDFGQVLVHFDPEYMTSVYVGDKEDISLVSSVVFDRLYWDRLDEGTISDEEVIALSLARLPDRLHEDARNVYKNWIYNIPEVDGMGELIEYIKKEYEVGVFLLSNISEGFAKHEHEIPILKAIDGCVFSAVCGLTKPDTKIFDYICNKYGLLPEETVFIDDNEANVKSAESVGIRSFLFQKNAAELKVWLDCMLKEKNA